MSIDTSKLKQSVELPTPNGKRQKSRTSPEPLPVADSKANTKKHLGQSTNALNNQVTTLVSAVDASDRATAQQLAEYVAERPDRFYVMLAQELESIADDQTFIESELLEIEVPDFRRNFLAFAPATRTEALPCCKD